VNVTNVEVPQSDIKIKGKAYTLKAFGSFEDKEPSAILN